MSNPSYSNFHICKRTKAAEREIMEAIIPHCASRSLINLMNLWELGDPLHRRFLFQALAVHAALATRANPETEKETRV